MVEVVLVVAGVLVDVEASVMMASVIASDMATIVNDLLMFKVTP